MPQLAVSAQFEYRSTSKVDPRALSVKLFHVPELRYFYIFVAAQDITY